MVDKSVNPTPSGKPPAAKSGNHRQPLPPPPQRRVANPAKPPSFDTSVEKLVVTALEKKASDIHIRVGHKPRIRIRGEMIEMSQEMLTTSDIFDQYLQEIISESQRKKFRQEKELDTAIFYPNVVRCRVNCFDSLSGGAMVLRLISLDIPSIDNLRLPQVIKKIVQAPQGLILITGPTGSGKSTTMAAAIDHLNNNFHKHIVTIEDPIEFVHTSKKCLISQREVGLHTLEFHQALRAVLREDPDVILVGEMRDRTTINTALQAAQTGHLVMGTLHTRNAIDSVNRLVNLYPPRRATCHPHSIG